MTHHIAYRTTNCVNMKFYFGIHSTDRDDLDPDYKGSGNALKAAVRKHGDHNFVRDNIAFFDTREELERWEKDVVGPWAVAEPMCYNLREGGESGWPVSDRTRARLSRSLRGHRKAPRTPEHTARINASRGPYKPCEKAMENSRKSTMRPVAVGDRVYGSVDEAFKAEGVSERTMHRWLNAGTHGARRLDKDDPRVLLVRLNRGDG